MTRAIGVALLGALFSLAAGCAEAQTPPPPSVEPPAPPPSGAPPPPPDASAAPAPLPPEAQAPVQAVPPGQWVYTQQYGWIWMTYADAYTYVPPAGAGEPLQYVFYPTYGWAWIAAPWVWGVGPWPAFGRYGPSRFAWYEHGWWRTPSRWRYREAPAPAPVAHAPRGVRPAPARHMGPRRTRDGHEREREGERGERRR